MRMSRFKRTEGSLGRYPGAYLFPLSSTSCIAGYMDLTIIKNQHSTGRRIEVGE